MKFGLIKSFLIYTLPILLVLITPFIWSYDLYNGIISAKQIWFYGAMSLLILAFGIDLLFGRKNLSFSLNIIDISLLTFYTYSIIRASFTPYTPLFYNTRFLNYSLLILFYFIVKYANSGSVFTKGTGYLISHDEQDKKEAVSSADILVIVLMLTVLIQAVWGLLQLYGFTRSFHSGFKITGTFFNPAPYSLYLAAVFPLALGVYLFINVSDQDTKKFLKTAFCAFFFYVKRTLDRDPLKKQQEVHKISFYDLILKYLSLITFISIMLVLPATMIRASWLAVLICGLLLLILRFKLIEKMMKFLYSPVRKVMAVIIIIFFTGISGIGLFYLKKESSVGKLLIWEVTLDKITEKPLFGHGVGRFEADYNNWQADYFKNHPEEMDGSKGIAAGNTKYCFNEYLEMVAELGLIGLLLFLAVIASVFLGINEILSHATLITKNDSKQMKAAGLMTREAPMTLIIIILSFISLLVCALISFPFYSLPTLILFFLLLAILSSRIEQISLPKRLSDLPIIRSLISVSTRSIRSSLSTLPIISVFLLLMAKQQYKAYYTLHEAVELYQTGGYGEACKSFSEVYNPLKYTGSYLQDYGKALNLDGEYQKSIEMLNRAIMFRSDEILYTTLGDTYKALKRYSEAEEAYKHASFMVPHKLYPLYLLANFYDETGQKGKALKIAEEVLNKKIKVESTATEEIRHEMKELIRKLKNQ